MLVGLFCLCCILITLASFLMIRKYRNTDENANDKVNLQSDSTQSTVSQYDGSSDKTTSDGRFKIDEADNFTLYYPSTFQYKQLQIQQSDRFKDPEEGSFGVHNYIEGSAGYYNDPTYVVDEYLRSRDKKALDECKFKANMELEARIHIFAPLKQKLIEYGLSKNSEVYGCYFVIGDSQEQHEYYYLSPAINEGGVKRMFYTIEVSYATDEKKAELDLLHEAVSKFTMLYAFEDPLDKPVVVGNIK